VTTLGPNTTPGTYEFQVLDLLHDPSFARLTQSQIDGYINEARKQLVMDTGCLRTLQRSYCTGGKEQYNFGEVAGAMVYAGGIGYSAPTVAFSGGGGSGVAATVTQSGGAVNAITFSNYGSGYSSAPTLTISDPTGTGAVVVPGIISVLTFDVLLVSITWGNERYATDWYPWRAFSPRFRPYTAPNYQRQPVAWAVYGETSIFLGPAPDQTYGMELDSIILPTPYVTGDTTTVDAIPVRNQDPIKFYAAYLAKKNARNMGEAESFFGDYTRKLHEVVGAYTGRVPDAYAPL
jgi:hypothetical protein